MTNSWRQRHDGKRERVTYTNMAKKTDGKDTTHVNLATSIPRSQWPVAQQDLLFSTELWAGTDT